MNRDERLKHAEKLLDALRAWLRVREESIRGGKLDPAHISLVEDTIREWWRRDAEEDTVMRGEKSTASGLVLPSWNCPICLAFNGEAKGPTKTCRACEYVRGSLCIGPVSVARAMGSALRGERERIVSYLRAQGDHHEKGGAALLAAHYRILASEIEFLPITAPKEPTL
jgi:hypothetical protein